MLKSPWSPPLRLSFFIALRYLASKGRSRSLVSLMTLLAGLGVFLGVMVPLIVMSVLIGLQKELRGKILGVKSHVTVTSTTSDGIPDYRRIVEELQVDPRIVSVSPYIETEGLMRFLNQYQPVMLRGVDADFFERDLEFSRICRLQSGARDLKGKYRAMVGSVLASNNFIDVSNRLSFVLARGGIGPDSEMTTVKAMVTGVFSTGYYEYDKGLIFISLPTLQSALGLEDRVTAIDVKIKDPWKADKLASELMGRWGYRLQVYSWNEMNRNLFAALANERVMIGVILIFILVVAIFNVMGSQVMLVLEKQKEIGILKTLGMTPAGIARIFLLEGLVITAIGALLGAVCGLAFAARIDLVLGGVEGVANLGIGVANWFLALFHALPANGPIHPLRIFSGDVYYLDKVPVDVSVARAVWMVVGALVLSTLAGLLPSLRAARLRPLEVIRYE